MLDIYEPLSFRASDPLPDWDFRVVAPFDGPAITIRGDFKANGIGEFVSKIRLDCNWLSGGVVYDRLDNAIVEPCKVYRSKGTAISVQSCRQSKFEGLQATEAILDIAAIEIKNRWDDRGDSTNACSFPFVASYAFGTYCGLWVGGNDVRGLGTCRNNIFGQVFLHPTWKRQVEMLPPEIAERFSDTIRLLYMNNCEDIEFQRLTMTTDMTCQASKAGRIDRCTFAGRVLVYDQSQFVAPKGDVSKLVCVVRKDG